MNAIAMSMSFCCPYDSVPASAPATWFSRKRSIISSARPPSPASGFAKRRAGSDQVVPHRQLAEHLQRLEGPSNAAPRQLERRPAGDVLAAELDRARRGLDLAQNAVEERRLAGSV